MSKIMRISSDESIHLLQAINAVKHAIMTCCALDVNLHPDLRVSRVEWPLKQSTLQISTQSISNCKESTSDINQIVKLYPLEGVFLGSRFFHFAYITSFL